MAFPSGGWLSHGAPSLQGALFLFFRQVNGIVSYILLEHIEPGIIFLFVLSEYPPRKRINSSQMGQQTSFRSSSVRPRMSKAMRTHEDEIPEYCPLFPFFFFGGSLAGLLDLFQIKLNQGRHLRRLPVGLFRIFRPHER
jgi:hypothetical protein